MFQSWLWQIPSKWDWHTLKFLYKSLPLSAVPDAFPHAAEFTLSVLCSGGFSLQSRYVSELKYAQRAAGYPENSNPWHEPRRNKPLWIKFLRDLLSAMHVVKLIHRSSPCLCIATSPGWHFWQRHENCTCAASGRWRQRKSVLCLWDTVPRQLYFHI